MARRDRRPVVALDGDLVIDGRVRARLLGLPLLDLDAHVVVASARPQPVPVSLSAQGRDRANAVADGQAPALSRAARLLDEGSNALEDARRIR
jgi:hypothetical protein